jgi:hypothetical protein
LLILFIDEVPHFVAGDAELEGVGVLDVGIEPTPEDDAG